MGCWHFQQFDLSRLTNYYHGHGAPAMWIYQENTKKGQDMNHYQAGGVSEDMGKLLLRASLAILILLHGIAKIFNGIGFITGMVTKLGLPAEFAYLVYVGEVLAPLLVLFGIWTRPAALVIAINMVFAVVLVHMGELLSLGKTGGWALELQGMFLAASLAVALLGAGRYSLGGSRWN